MGKIRNLAWSAFGGNDRLKPCRPLYKLGAFRRWWQRGETCGDRGSELGHIGIFGRALDLAAGDRPRSEERRVGNGCVSTGIYRWSRAHSHTINIKNRQK